MRYLVIGNSAILASRSIERIEAKDVLVAVVGVPDDATLCLFSETEGKAYPIVSQSTTIPADDLKAGSIYSVTVVWKDKNFETGEEIEREADGGSFHVYFEGGTQAILPVPLSSAGELERMWKGIADTLEEILPVLDRIKNGNDVI